MKSVIKISKILVLLVVCGGLTSCDDMRVYGSVGVSSYGGHGGYYGSPRVGTSISVGGRIY
jgi:hypothetical protein